MHFTGKFLNVSYLHLVGCFLSDFTKYLDRHCIFAQLFKGITFSFKRKTLIPTSCINLKIWIMLVFASSSHKATKNLIKVCWNVLLLKAPRKTVVCFWTGADISYAVMWACFFIIFVSDRKFDNSMGVRKRNDWNLPRI